MCGVDLIAVVRNSACDSNLWFQAEIPKFQLQISVKILNNIGVKVA